MFLKTGILKYGRIRDLRNDRGLTQAEIAEILKVKQNTYCQYETGTLNYPVDVVVTLAEYYGVSSVDSGGRNPLGASQRGALRRAFMV